MHAAAHAEGIEAEWLRETRRPGLRVRRRICALRCTRPRARRALEAIDLAAYAGHDAGVLARHLPAAMLFVRNPTGISHNPAETASEEDCLAACAVLAPRRSLPQPRLTRRCESGGEAAPPARRALALAQRGALPGRQRQAADRRRRRAAQRAGVVARRVDQLAGRVEHVRMRLRQAPEGLDAGRPRGRQHLRGAAEALGQLERAVAQLEQRDGVVGGVVELRAPAARSAPHQAGPIVALGRAQQPPRDGRERRVAPLVGGSWIDQWRSKTRNAQLVSMTVRQAGSPNWNVSQACS